MGPKLAAIRRDLKIRGYIVGQFPNPPLWVALAALLVAWLTDDGSVIDDLARAISIGEEIVDALEVFNHALGLEDQAIRSFEEALDRAYLDAASSG